MPRETVGSARDRVRRVVHALPDLCKVEFVPQGFQLFLIVSPTATKAFCSFYL